MDIITKLEQMVAEGKKVVSIDFMISELRGIPPSRQQTNENGHDREFYSQDELRVV
jgi:hypothetical protein